MSSPQCKAGGGVVGVMQSVRLVLASPCVRLLGNYLVSGKKEDLSDPIAQSSCSDPALLGIEGRSQVKLSPPCWASREGHKSNCLRPAGHQGKVTGQTVPALLGYRGKVTGQTVPALLGYRGKFTGQTVPALLGYRGKVTGQTVPALLGIEGRSQVKLSPPCWAIEGRSQVKLSPPCWAIEGRSQAIVMHCSGKPGVFTWTGTLRTGEHYSTARSQVNMSAPSSSGLEVLLSSLQKAGDIESTLNVLNVLDELLSAGTDRRICYLISKGGSEALLTTLVNTVRSYSQNFTVLLPVLHLLAKVGHRDRRIGEKAEKADAVLLTLTLLRHNMRHGRRAASCLWVIRVFCSSKQHMGDCYPGMYITVPPAQICCGTPDTGPVVPVRVEVRVRLEVRMKVEVRVEVKGGGEGEGGCGGEGGGVGEGGGEGGCGGEGGGVGEGEVRVDVEVKVEVEVVDRMDQVCLSPPRHMAPVGGASVSVYQCGTKSLSNASDCSVIQAEKSAHVCGTRRCTQSH
ncbi:hypothetical protein P4O66_003923 [Electrophorus voltai]|uniref:Uncharacterized protein n=1 Tax=Electrophorus voltai TaxID=2609070 RepID=A0AAD9E4F0_9TELE|nr:hypothetical protein P4O66_003923 [Electrophorus voltai]